MLQINIIKQYTIYNRQVWLLIVYCLLSTAFGFSQSTSPQIDSLLTLLKKDKEDTNKVNTLNALSWQLYLTGSYDSALLYAENAKQLGEKITPITIGVKKGIAKAYGNIGNVYSVQGNYPDALKNHFAALKISEGILSEAKELSQKQDAQKRIASSYNNIGNVYYRQGNYPDALKNYFASLKIKEEIGDKRGIGNSYNNIGEVYFNQGNCPDALKNYFASLKIKEEVGDKLGIAASYNNIGNVYYDQGNYPDALKNHFAALKITEELGDKQGIAASYGNIGNVYIDLNRPKDGIDFLNKGLLLAKEIGSKDFIQESYSSLAAADSALGNYKSAYNNYKMYIIYKDSLLNEENTKKTVQLQMQYEFDKKEAKAKAEAEKQKAVAVAEKKKQQVILYSVIGGLLVVLVFAVFIFRALRITQKQKKVIEEQKKLVEEKQKEILDSIHYARRIQNSILPTEKYIDKTFKRLMKK